MHIKTIMKLADAWAEKQNQTHPWAPKTNEETKGQQAICQIREEFEQFLTLLREYRCMKGNACEIGMGLGGSHYVFRQAFDLVVSVEPDQSVIDHFLSRNPDLNGKGAFVMGKSEEPHVLQSVRKFAPFQMIFVDGEHSYEGVSQDYKDYFPMLAKGGVMAFHDSKGDPRVSKFTQDLESGEFDGKKHELTRFELGEVAGITCLFK